MLQCAAHRSNVTVIWANFNAQLTFSKSHTRAFKRGGKRKARLVASKILRDTKWTQHHPSFWFFFHKPKYFNGKPSQKFRINNDIITEVCIIFQERNKIVANIYWFLAIYSGSLMSRGGHLL